MTDCLPGHSEGSGTGPVCLSPWHRNWLQGLAPVFGLRFNHLKTRKMHEYMPS